MVDNNQENALMKSSSANHIDIVELILNKDANPNIQAEDGNTALMLAEKRGYTDIAQLIKTKVNQEN